MAKRTVRPEIVNQCKDCRFWLELSDSPVGMCRRHAPHAEFTTADIRHTDKSLSVTWPGTRPTEWCGDFEREA